VLLVLPVLQALPLLPVSRALPERLLEQISLEQEPLWPQAQLLRVSPEPVRLQERVWPVSQRPHERVWLEPLWQRELVWRVPARPPWAYLRLSAIPKGSSSKPCPTPPNALRNFGAPS
jgi:hypothetical protein